MPAGRSISACQDFAKAAMFAGCWAPGARGTRDKSAMYMGALYYSLTTG